MDLILIILIVLILLTGGLVPYGGGSAFGGLVGLLVLVLILHLLGVF